MRALRQQMPLMAVALMLLFPACGSDQPTAPSGPMTELPRPLTKPEAEAIDASNAFAFDLLREVTAEEEAGTNVVVSPLSVSMALGMQLAVI